MMDILKDIKLVTYLLKYKFIKSKPKMQIIKLINIELN